MGTAPPQVLGKRFGRTLKKAGRSKKKTFSLGRIVGRALVRGGHAGNLVEFRRGDNVDDWTDPKKVFGSVGSPDSGLAGKVVKNTQQGGRLARDAYDYFNKPKDSAEFGPFTVKANSPNTIRVTSGPTRRNRRQKNEWEKVGTQRTLWKYGTGAALLASGVGVKYLTKQHPSGDVLKGLGVVLRRGKTKAGNIIEGVKAGASGRTPRMAPVRVNKDIEEKADQVFRNKIKREGTQTLNKAS